MTAFSFNSSSVAALRQLLQQISRQSIRIYFQSRGERALWAETRAFPTERGSLDGQVQIQHVSPKRLVVERIKAKICRSWVTSSAAFAVVGSTFRSFCTAVSTARSVGLRAGWQ